MKNYNKGQLKKSNIKIVGGDLKLPANFHRLMHPYPKQILQGKIAENLEFQWMKKCTLGIALNLLVIKN